MFIIHRRGPAVLATLFVTALFVLLAGCTTQSPLARAPAGAAAAVQSCPVGRVAVCRSSGPVQNAEVCRCQSPSQAEAGFEWLNR
jgi:type IV secretory pathway protease TraF